MSPGKDPLSQTYRNQWLSSPQLNINTWKYPEEYDLLLLAFPAAKGTDRTLFFVVWRMKKLLVNEAERQKREWLKRAVETSTLSLRVNTASDVGNKNVWGARSRGSKHGNNKWHAMRLNTMVSLSLRAAVPSSSHRAASASTAINERSFMGKVRPTVSSKKFSRSPQRCNLRTFHTGLCVLTSILVVGFIFFYFFFKYCFLGVEVMWK